MQLTLGNVMSLSTTFAARSDMAASEVSMLANLALSEVNSRLHHKPKEAKAVSSVTGGGDERELELPNDFDGSASLVWYSTTTDEDSGANILGERIHLSIVDTTIIDSNSSISGQPARYAIYGNRIEIDPIPNSRGSFEIRYLAKQETLVLSTSTPDLDDRWHPGWMYLTAAHVARARSDKQTASEYDRMYVNYMVSTPNDRIVEQTDKQGLGLSVRKS
jgi:hypothetical protein